MEILNKHVSKISASKNRVSFEYEDDITSVLWSFASSLGLHMVQALKLSLRKRACLSAQCAYRACFRGCFALYIGLTLLDGST